MSANKWCDHDWKHVHTHNRGDATVHIEHCDRCQTDRESPASLRYNVEFKNFRVPMWTADGCLSSAYAILDAQQSQRVITAFLLKSTADEYAKLLNSQNTPLAYDQNHFAKLNAQTKDV